MTTIETLEEWQKERADRPTEFEVQAYLYAELSKFIPVVRGEVEVRPSLDSPNVVRTKRGKHRGVRYDLAAFSEDGRPLFTVEVKSTSRKAANQRMGGHMNRLYRTVNQGIPHFTVGGMKESEEFIRGVLEEWQKRKEPA